MLITVNIFQYFLMYSCDGMGGGMSTTETELTAMKYKFFINIFNKSITGQFFYKFGEDR